MQPPRPYPPELVDPATVSPAAPYRALKQFGLALLCAAWVALGIAGHDPWKTEDATSIGVAAEMAGSRDFVVPTLAGEPYLPRPPLVYIGGALAIDAFAPPLSVHNAARIFAGIALAIVLLATALASRELNGRAFRWLPVLILVGSVGFWDRAHVLSPELLLTVGIAVGLYGFALALRRPAWGGAVLGVGAAIAFLGHGLQGPAWLLVAALILPACGPEWRNRAYAFTLAIAVTVAVLVALPWPLALHARDPALFAQWWASETLAQYIAMLGGGNPESGVLPAQPRLVRVAVAAAPAVAPVAARPRIQRRPARAGHRRAGRAGARDPREPARDARGAARERAAAARAAGAAGRRSRSIR